MLGMLAYIHNRQPENMMNEHMIVEQILLIYKNI